MPLPSVRRLAVPAAGALLILATSCATPPAATGAGPVIGTPPAGTTSTTSTTSTTTTTPDASPTPAPAASLLRRGDSGPEVLALQERLDSLGYWLGEPDGAFGTLTEQAVYALQGAAALSRDGIVGPATSAALDAGTRPRARSGSGTVTEIDRDAGLISFVRDGQVQLVLHTSTGTFEPYRFAGRSLLADTPGGSFTVSWAVDGVRDGSLGELYRPRYFHPDGIAVHGYPSVPAYPASHGCARVTPAAMDMVWARDLMPRSSEVLVF
ncbi:L,D-transpeptidase family protein [Pseudonocardia sp.]|uniref:L,D-transpeptidase family protein n=1 Tax=Pseudonocardia sp. TaxID=60912 RepID=UPI00260CDC50|nr:L,D-transpeptidase family protein [Pseudonocardia sp.]